MPALPLAILVLVVSCTRDERGETTAELQDGGVAPTTTIAPAVPPLADSHNPSGLGANERQLLGKWALEPRHNQSDSSSVAPPAVLDFAALNNELIATVMVDGCPTNAYQVAVRARRIIATGDVFVPAVRCDYDPLPRAELMAECLSLGCSYRLDGDALTLDISNETSLELRRTG